MRSIFFGRALSWLVCLCVVLTMGPTAFAQSAYSDGKVQPPNLAPPSRGSLVGQYAAVAFGPADVSRGGFSLPLPIDVPTERAELSASPFPAYSPDAGLSEWGAGWSVSNLEVRRFRVLGDLDWATDELTGPWGRMVRGHDGAWYPAGLGALVRVEQPTEDTLVAYLPLGQRWTYGGSFGTEAGSGGTYAWKLVAVESISGQRATYSYVRNDSGRLFLESVEYGAWGAGDAPAKVTISTEPVDTPIVDYRSGYPRVLDRRVRRVTAYVRHAESGDFAERWHFDVGYTTDGLGPSFYLSSLRQTFASGTTAPELTYDYGSSSALLAEAEPRRIPKIDAVLSQFGGDVIQPNYAATFDVDLDGRPDLELARDGTLLRQTDNGFEQEALAPASGATVNLCRRTPSTVNPSRVLAYMRPDDDEARVLGFSRSGTTTTLTLCNREGELLLDASVRGDWEVSAKTKLVDVDRDHRPDLVHVQSGSYEVLPNASDAAGYAWGAVKRGILTPSVVMDASWIHDINGDGLPDIVGRVLSSFVVWFNKGNFEFEAQGKSLNFMTATGMSFPSPGSYASLFLDANNDGLTDVLLYKTQSAVLFVNTGSQFRQVRVPALTNAFGWYRPVPVDLAGSGEIELAFARGTEGHSLALTAPGVGLLMRADDGRGNALDFEYERVPATPGGRDRPTVLRTLRVETTGHEPVTYEYDYTSPRLHSLGRFLVGFDGVSRRASLATTSMTFFNDDEHAGLFLASVEHDALLPAVERVSFRTYDDASAFGLSWKRLRTEGSGWRSTDPLRPDVWLESREVLGYDREICPSVQRTTSSHGSLLHEVQYTDVTALAKSLSCLPSYEVLSATHEDSSLDFHHVASNTYDARGFFIRRSRGDGTEASVVDEEASYTYDGRVQSLGSPGKGTTLFDYHPSSRLLERITTPDGVITTAERDPRMDTVRRLTVDRGGSLYEQHFRFDGQERLAKSWNNQTSGPSESVPNLSLSYRYATPTKPALIRSDTLVHASSSSVVRRVEATTASGDALATLRLAPEGWQFERLARHERSLRRTTTLSRPFAQSLDVMGLEVDTLFVNATTVDVEQLSMFGVPVSSSTKLHAEVERRVATALDVRSGLERTDVENDEFSTLSSFDARDRLVRQRDPGGASTSFVYDALGRLRVVKLADGTRHRVDIDALGRIRRIAREGVATIDYRYDPTTSALVEKTFSPPPGSARSGEAIRRVSLTYDTIGRVSKELDTDVTTAESQAFDYYYDGATPDDPLDRSARGLLTAVAGEGYLKTLRYRGDGSLASRRVTVAGARVVRTDLEYFDDGTVRERVTSVADATGNVLARDAETNAVDAYGRLVSTSRDDHPFAAYAYDVEGRPLWATYSGPFAADEVVTLTHDPLTHARVGLNQNSVSWSAAMSRRMNARGLVGDEDIAVASTVIHRAFQYSRSGYLEQSSDASTTYAYEYESTGLPKRIVRTSGGDVEDLVFARAGATLTAGSHRLTFDELGRVIERDDVRISYGPNGQVASASRGPSTWRYLYDERGWRIAKLDASGAVRAIYDDDAVITDTSITTPIHFAGQLVGVLETTLGATPTKRFRLVASDLVGTALSDTDGTARFASPYGERSERPDVAEAFDYAAKGWDADLGVVRMGVRDYDPTLARFTTPDPFFLEKPEGCLDSPDECNLYGYAKNRPNLYTDPSGLCAYDACLAEGGAAAYVAGAFLAAATTAYLASPEGQRSLSVALAAGSRGASDAAEEALGFGKRALQATAETWAAYKAGTFQSRFGADSRYIFATYTVRLADGSIYSGRTSGLVARGESDAEAAVRIVDQRWRSHHMLKNAKGYASAQYDAYAAGDLRRNHFAKDAQRAAMNYAAIRGREQQLIDANGGARSGGGTSGNRIRGVASKNAFAPVFDAASHSIITPRFGPASDFR